MQLRNAAALRPGGGFPGPDSGGEGGQDLIPQGLPPGVVLRTHGQHLGVGLVHGLIAVFLPDLFAVAGFVGFHNLALERLKFLRIGHFIASLCFYNSIFNGQDQSVQPFPAGLQFCQMALQRLLAVKGRILQNGPDGL